MALDFLSEPDVPEYYSDAVRIAVGAYGFLIELGVQGPPDTPSSELPRVKRLALVRMSPQHALILARLIEKNVKIYQDTFGKIQLPAAVFEGLDLPPE
jgi:hypothetical protein